MKYGSQRNISDVLEDGSSSEDGVFVDDSDGSSKSCNATFNQRQPGNTASLVRSNAHEYASAYKRSQAAGYEEDESGSFVGIGADYNEVFL
jgi:hypothetical protein